MKRIIRQLRQPKVTAMDVEHERAELLEAVRNLAFLIERAGDLPKIYEYIQQLHELRTKLVALGPVVKIAK